MTRLDSPTGRAEPTYTSTPPQHAGPRRHRGRARPRAPHFQARSRRARPQSQHWLTPGRHRPGADGPSSVIARSRSAGAGIYAFGERTPGRAAIRPGDRLCFYASAKGVVAHATVASLARAQACVPEVRHADQVPLDLPALRDAKPLPRAIPVVLDEAEALRARRLRQPRPGPPLGLARPSHAEAHEPTTFDLLTRR